MLARIIIKKEIALSTEADVGGLTGKLVSRC